jgi:hypothetical protein
MAITSGRQRSAFRPGLNYIGEDESAATEESLHHADITNERVLRLEPREKLE